MGRPCAGRMSQRRHFHGAAQAAKLLRREGTIANATYKRLIMVDNAFQLIRHVMATSCGALLMASDLEIGPGDADGVIDSFLRKCEPEEFEAYNGDDATTGYESGQACTGEGSASTRGGPELLAVGSLPRARGEPAGGARQGSAADSGEAVGRVPADCVHHSAAVCVDVRGSQTEVSIATHFLAEFLGDGKCGVCFGNGYVPRVSGDGTQVGMGSARDGHRQEVLGHWLGRQGLGQKGAAWASV